MWRRGRWTVALLVAAAVASGVVLAVRALVGRGATVAAACTVGRGPASLLLAPAQAENATTIAAVGRRLGLPPRAVTVALATALQETKLHNYPFGDRDSLGLFQQRPSQGWGRPDQLLTPAYAAAAFYRHLASVPGWRRLPVAAAAQQVQHSADGSAYAQWEEQARAMAAALTGRRAGEFGCRFDHPGRAQPAALARLADQELGPGELAQTGADATTDWAVASWLVGHAQSYGVVAVTVRGRRWSPSTGRWTADPRADVAVHYTLAPASPSPAPS